MTSMKRGSLKLAASALLSVVLLGCNENKKYYGDHFPPDEQVRAPQRFTAVQMASGARADATLREHHFDRDRINMLGEAKLAAMLADDEAAPMIVYLDAPADKRDARQQSVSAALKDMGVLEDQVKFEHGPNPRSVSPAASHLANLRRTDSAAASGGYGESDSLTIPMGETK